LENLRYWQRRTIMAEMVIRRVGVLSLAKMQALLGFVIGLIIGVIYGLVFIILGATISSFAARGQGGALGVFPPYSLASDS
jgi:hypothetical protein